MEILEMIKVQMISKRILLMMMVLLLAVACTPGAAQPTEPEATDESGEVQAPDVSEPTEPEDAPTGETETITMWVAAETADCVGVAPQTCLLVKFDRDDEWPGRAA